VEKVTGNGGVIDLGGTNVNIASNTVINASGCAIANGSANAGGAIYMENKASAMFVSCVFSSNRASPNYGGAVYQFGSGSALYSGCAFSDNSAPYANYGNAITVYANGGANVATLKDCTFEAGQTICLRGASASLALSGSNTILSYIKNLSSFEGGTVTISSGAILDLTGNTNAAPIAPGGGITLDASPSSGVVIIGSAGSGTQTRTFAGGGTITGSAVTKIGAISGATVTLPSSSCQIEFVKSGETVVSSAFIQASETPYVLETQQGAGAVLVRAIED